MDVLFSEFVHFLMTTKFAFANIPAALDSFLAQKMRLNDREEVIEIDGLAIRKCSEHDTMGQLRSTQLSQPVILICRSRKNKIQVSRYFK